MPEESGDRNYVDNRLQLASIRLDLEFVAESYVLVLRGRVVHGLDLLRLQHCSVSPGVGRGVGADAPHGGQHTRQLVPFEI